MSLYDPYIIALFLTLGSLAGLLAGLLGIGGGIILVPLFLWAFPHAGFSPEIAVHTAFGTSLAVIIPTTVSSTLVHRSHGNVEWHQVLRLCLGGVFGALGGAGIAAGLSGDWLKGLFGGMQIAVSLKMFLGRKYLPPEREDPIPTWQLLLVGFCGGAFSAFFGVGGGVVAVPLMVIALRLPIHLAVGNSSALIAISSLFGALSYAVHGWKLPGLPPFSLGYVNMLVALLVSPLSVCCARIGVRLGRRLPHEMLVKIFAIMLALVGVRIVVLTFFL